MRYIDSFDMGYTPCHYEKDDKHLLARAYVLYQKFEHVYAPLEALKRGTAFEELDKPHFCMKP